MQSFVHLHTHSHFSLMRGTASPEKLCRRAVELGLDTLALTDTNGLYGLQWFLEEAREHNLRPIIGAEAVTENARALLIARNRAGYAQLCTCLTALHADKQDFNLATYLREHTTDDLVIISDARNLLETLAGRAHCYAELQACRGHYELLQWARAQHIPPVATGPVWLLEPDDFKNHRLLRAIDRNTTLDQIPNDDLAPSDALLRSATDMAAAFTHCPEAVENTRRIADACQTEWDFSAIIFPDLVTKEEADRILRAKCEAGAKRRYGRISHAVRERLDHELNIIGQMGFANYFLVVEDIVEKSPRTCGRGSAAASIVSYCLGITHVDPIKHRLFFERFLNLGRKDPPDIDVDFAWDERDDIFDYVFATYGDGKAAMIANHVTLQPRAAFREVAKVYGMPEGEIKVFSDRLRHMWGVRDVEAVMRHHPMFRDIDLPDPWPEILQRAQGIAGAPRHLSVHCGGVVITPDRLDHTVPLETAPKGVPIVQWEKDQAEAAGLVKIDLLGNRSLAVIRDALAAVREHYGMAIDYAAFNPLEDLRTREIVRTGDSIGCFYIESPATRQLLQKTNSGDFENLVVVSSIIRPAANREAREYVRRLHGGEWDPVHPIVESVLQETFGIMVYQEDVSRTAIALAGFDPADADDLRKVLTKKHKGRRLKDFARRFVAGARVRKVPDAVISRVWDMMMSFAGYSFCKPHSASYAMVSFKSAYLRAHYPAEFLAAVISNMGGYYRTFAYCSDAVRLGLSLRSPDVNESRREYWGINREIRVGFMQIKGLRSHAIDDLLEERDAAGKFASLEDYLRRVSPDPADARLLIKAGCFDETADGRTRPELMWVLVRWDRLRETSRQMSLLEDPVPTQPRGPLPKVEQYDDATMLRHEAETLGFLVSRHPLTLYTHRLRGMKITAGRDLPQHVGRTVTTVGWYVTAKMTSTKNEESMEFVSFEDTTALYETTFFPRAYERFCALITRNRPFLLRGRVEEDFGAAMLNINYVELLDEQGRKQTAQKVSDKEHEDAKLMKFFPV
jgi:error-prone DNA polymerase